jgi:hypothetical protein
MAESVKSFLNLLEENRITLLQFSDTWMKRPENIRVSIKRDVLPNPLSTPWIRLTLAPLKVSKQRGQLTFRYNIPLKDGALDQQDRIIAFDTNPDGAILTLYRAGNKGRIDYTAYSNWRSMYREDKERLDKSGRDYKFSNSLRLWVPG